MDGVIVLFLISSKTRKRFVLRNLYSDLKLSWKCPNINSILKGFQLCAADTEQIGEKINDRPPVKRGINSEGDRRALLQEAAEKCVIILNHFKPGLIFLCTSFLSSQTF